VSLYTEALKILLKTHTKYYTYGKTPIIAILAQIVAQDENTKVLIVTMNSFLT